MTKAMEYATDGERAYARAIVRDVLSRGLSLSVFDGEEWTVSRSTNAQEILEALATTDMDELIVSDASGARLGWLQLIWGNDPDGSELIADCTNNELCTSICDNVAACY